jgi:hypothetical protein
VISTNDIRALELYEVALSLIEATGTPVSASTLVACRAGYLTIHHSAKTGHLEVWHLSKVLTVNRVRRTLKVTYYAPGEWEDELEAAAKLRPKE